MKLSYFHVAGDGPYAIKSQTAVVIDVLRATTTIAWALNNGAEAVETFSDIDLLKNKAKNCSASSRLLIGERGGKKSMVLIWEIHLLMSSQNWSKAKDFL